MPERLDRLEARLAALEAAQAAASTTNREDDDRDHGDGDGDHGDGDAGRGGRAGGGAPFASGSSDGSAAGPVYDSVVEWMHGFFLPTFIRTAGGPFRWCERWSEHGEAMLRLEAMWRAWEVLRLDAGLGMSTFLLHHLDPGLAALTAGAGPFAQCTPDRHGPSHLPGAHPANW